MSKAIAISPGRSWYEDSVDMRPSYRALREQTECDVAIIGGGFTGLSAAYHLAKAGIKVSVIDGACFGDGASGRNGGQLGTGQRQWVDVLEKQYGFAYTKALFDLAEEAKADVLTLSNVHNIEFTAGQLSVAYHAREIKHYHNHIETMQRYGYEHFTFMDQAEAQERLGSKLYYGGLRDMGTGHIHPLKLVVALAMSAKQAGAMLYENTKATNISRSHGKLMITTEHSSIKADHVLLATNAYNLGLQHLVEQKIVAIRSYIGATQPLPDGCSILKGNEAVDDSRFVVRYFRKSKDNRLLFGGAESYGNNVPSDLSVQVRQQMMQVYPELKDIPLTHTWGGTVGITVERMPYVHEIMPNVTYCGGYSGHGVMMAPFMGKLYAEQILAKSERISLFKDLKIRSFPGGIHLRRPFLFLAMQWFSLLDRL